MYQVQPPTSTIHNFVTFLKIRFQNSLAFDSEDHQFV